MATVQKGYVVLYSRHINYKPVPHIALHHTLVCGIDVTDINEFNVGNDTVVGTIIQHLLGFGKASNQ